MSTKTRGQPAKETDASPETSPDTYITMSGIGWETFEGIADRTRGGRVRYDDGELEIMSPSIQHEGFGDCLRDLVAALTEHLGIDEIGVGSTTWKSPGVKKGAEADAAFYLDPAKLPAVIELKARGEKEITKYPPPDLVIEIEIDMRRPDGSRPGVFAAVGAVELWEFNGRTARIRRLGPNRSYVDADHSGWLKVTPALIERAVREAPPLGTVRRRWLRTFVADHLKA